MILRAMSDSAIDIRRLTKTYQRGGETLRVLDELDLQMDGGTFYALMGPSGSGKTTLLNLVGALDTPDSGDVVVGGENLADLNGAELARWRADHVGFVFQGFNLLPVLTARENVELPLLLAPLSRSARRAQAERALLLVGLEDRMDHRPRELSGGQEQRVAIARAIVTDPTILIADEPTGDLDATSAEEILLLLTQLKRQFHKTIVMVTHDPRSERFVDTVYRLDKGVFIGSTTGGMSATPLQPSE